MTIHAAATALSVWGAPGPAPTLIPDPGSTTDTVSVTLTEVSGVGILSSLSTSDTVNVTLTDASSLNTATVDTLRTQLGVGASPTPYTVIGDRVPSILVPIVTSDAVNVQWNEDPVSSNTITSQDSAVRVTLTEQSVLFNSLNPVDSANVTLSETVGLVIVGITTITSTDTVSTHLTEASAVNVTVITGDTTNVTLTDSSSLSTSAQFITTSDTVSVSVGDASLLGIFTGVLQFTSDDSLNVSVDDESSLDIIVPTKPMRMRIHPLKTRIQIIPI